MPSEAPIWTIADMVRIQTGYKGRLYGAATSTGGWWEPEEVAWNPQKCVQGGIEPIYPCQRQFYEVNRRDLSSLN